MSPASSSRRGVYVEGPRNDIYTVLLAIALFAIVCACLFLVLEWHTYDFKSSPQSAIDGRVGTTTLALSVQAVSEWPETAGLQRTTRTALDCTREGSLQTA